MDRCVSLRLETKARRPSPLYTQHVWASIRDMQSLWLQIIVQLWALSTMMTCQFVGQRSLSCCSQTIKLVFFFCDFEPMIIQGLFPGLQSKQLLYSVCPEGGAKDVNIGRSIWICSHIKIIACPAAKATVTSPNVPWSLSHLWSPRLCLMQLTLSVLSQSPWPRRSYVFSTPCADHTVRSWI